MTNGTLPNSSDTGEVIGVEGTWADLLDPEFRALVPKHWLQFKPPAPGVQYTLGALYIIIMTAGVVGNTCIIWLFCSTKALRTPSNYLVLNLAFSDFLIISKMPVFIYNSFSLGPVAGAGWCQYYAFVGGFSGTSAIMTIAAMAVERFITISRPLDPSCRITHGKGLAMIIFVWIYALSFSVTPFFGINRYVPEGFLTSCSFDYLSDDLSSKIFVLVFFVAAWCVPMVVVSSCYLGILVCVRKAQRSFVQHSEKMHMIDRNLEKQRQTEIKLAKIAFCLISLWTISWTPYATVALTGLFTDRSLLTPLASMIPALFCKMASVLDPFVYGLTSRRFKVELKKRANQLLGLKKVGKSPMTLFKLKSIHHEIDTSAGEVEDRQALSNSSKSISSLSDESANYSETARRESVHRVFSAPGIRNETSEDVNDPSQVRSVKVFLIPRMYALEMTQEHIKIKVRRSL